MQDFDYQLETKLKTESPALHQIFASNVIACQNMLIKYKAVFPTFTDHSSLHSMEVLAFCNNLVGQDIEKMNTDEIFVLLMGAYLHDVGMGIDEKNYYLLLEKIPEAKEYLAAHPGDDMAHIIRRYHNEFSGKFIEKFGFLFDIPSDEHLFAIVQISRGHRLTDLFDEKEYPAKLKVPSGNEIRLPYLAALIRLADELDIAIDRNLQFLYDINTYTEERDIKEYSKHEAIKNVEFMDDRFVATVKCHDDELKADLDKEFKKLSDTLSYCVKVVEERTPFRIKQKKIDINWI